MASNSTGLTILSDAMQVSHLKAGIWQYGEYPLDDHMKSRAVELGVLPAPSPSFDTDNSWNSTAANVLLAFAAAFNTANAFRMLNNSILDNSDVALHNRIKRDAWDTSSAQHVTLSNGNCVMIGLEDHPATGLVLPWKSIHVKCLDEPCYNQLFYSRDKGTNFEWGFALKNLRAVADSDLGIEVTFVHTPYGSTEPKLSNIHKYKCDDLGLSPRYQHLENCKKLKSEGHNEEALIECTKSLKADQNFKPAIELTDELNKLLAVTTIEPSSSTSLIEDNSTITTNSTSLIEGNSTITTNSTSLIEGNSTTTTNSTSTTEKTTTHIEANNAPFKGIATPTSTPHEQNTTNQGWSADDLCKAILSGMFTVAAIADIVTFVYKKGSAIYNKCLKCFNGSLEESYSENKQSDHLSNCETLPENMQNTTMRVLNDVLNVAEDANMYGPTR